MHFGISGYQKWTFWGLIMEKNMQKLKLIQGNKTHLLWGMQSWENETIKFPLLLSLDNDKYTQRVHNSIISFSPQFEPN